MLSKKSILDQSATIFSRSAGEEDSVDALLEQDKEYQRVKRSIAEKEIIENYFSPEYFSPQSESSREKISALLINVKIKEIDDLNCVVIPLFEVIKICNLAQQILFIRKKCADYSDKIAEYACNKLEECLIRAIASYVESRDLVANYNYMTSLLERLSGVLINGPVKSVFDDTVETLKSMGATIANMGSLQSVLSTLDVEKKSLKL